MDNEYTLLLAGAFVLFWLFWLPRALAPVMVSRYDGLPPWLKAAIALAMPTLEQAILVAWDNAYHAIELMVDETPTELDDRLLEEIDRQVRRILNEQNKVYTNPDQTYTAPSDFRITQELGN